MSSTLALLKRAQRLKQKANPIQAPRSYSMVLFEDEEVSPDLLAQLGRHDTLVIRRMARGYLGDVEDEQAERGQVMSCWIDKGRRGRVPCVVREYGVNISMV